MKVTLRKLWKLLIMGGIKDNDAINWLQIPFPSEYNDTYGKLVKEKDKIVDSECASVDEVQVGRTPFGRERMKTACVINSIRYKRCNRKS